MYNSKDKDLRNIPFDKNVSALGLENQAEWLLPAAFEYINKNFKLEYEEGLISPLKTIRAFAVDTDSNEVKWVKGLFSFLTQSPRSKIIGSVPQIKNVRYCALVPLILSVFKQDRAVDYSEWDWRDPYIGLFVDKDLVDLVRSEPCTISNEELIEARDYSALYKSGKNVGSKRGLTSITSITSKTENQVFNSLPRLRKIIDTQVWVAHPSLRFDLMILDSKNLDDMPLSLGEYIEPVKIENNDEEDDIWHTQWKN